LPSAAGGAGVARHTATELSRTPVASSGGLRPPSDASQEGKQKLDGVIDHAVDAIREGRDAVQDLRSSVTVTNDLALALNALAQELAADTNHNANAPVVQVEVEGAPRDLGPVVQDEVYRIAGEGLRNAFKHADSQHIEVEIRYDERQLRLRLRDDGKVLTREFSAAMSTKDTTACEVCGSGQSFWWKAHRMEPTGFGNRGGADHSAARAYTASPGGPVLARGKAFRKDKEGER